MYRKPRWWDFVSILLSTFVLFYPKSSQEGSIMTWLANSLDWTLCFWILVLNIFGQKVLKSLSLPKWFPRTPVMMLFLAVTVACLFGASQTPATADFATCVRKAFHYGLLNGAVLWLMSIANYDVIHCFLRDRGKDIVNLFKKLFKKKEVKENDKN